MVKSFWTSLIGSSLTEDDLKKVLQYSVQIAHYKQQFYKCAHIDRKGASWEMRSSSSAKIENVCRTQ